MRREKRMENLCREKKRGETQQCSMDKNVAVLTFP
jgi:hypothetical protein